MNDKMIAVTGATGQQGERWQESFWLTDGTCVPSRATRANRPRRS